MDRLSTHNSISPAQWCGVFLALLAGLYLRYLQIDVQTSDQFQFIIPWFEYAKLHGWGAIGDPFTNYTPFYSYMLIFISKLPLDMEPIHVVKLLSVCFDVGCAFAAATIARTCGASRVAQLVSACAVWCAPVVAKNSAGWGQCDSIWTFFILLSVLFFCCRQMLLGVIAFGLAFAFKAPAAFLAPLIMGFVLARRLHWSVLVLPLIVYALVMAPAWMSGYPARDLATVYVAQAHTYGGLSMNAPNLWALIPDEYYQIGVIVGLALGAIVGLAISVASTALLKHMKPELILLVATITMMTMPFVLPKMHDRYSYSFEILVIILACVTSRREIILSAIAAQIVAMCAYSVFEYRIGQFMQIAITLNILVVFTMWRVFLSTLKHEASVDGQSSRDIGGSSAAIA